MNSCEGGLSGQKLVPRTMMLNEISISSCVCSIRVLKASVRSLLRLISNHSVSVESEKKSSEWLFIPVNIRCSLFVYSNPQASFNFEIMLASLSSDAETP